MKYVGLLFKITVIGILTVNNLEAAAEQIFSFEKISASAFEDAFHERDKFYTPVFADSVIPNDITEQIIKDAYIRFIREDPDMLFAYEFQDIEDSIRSEGDARDRWFSTESVLKFNDLPLYGFLIPRYPDHFLFCYDSETGEYAGSMYFPSTISPRGIIVSQIGHDCDWTLALVLNQFKKDEVDRTGEITIVSTYYNPHVHAEFFKDYTPETTDCPYFVFWGSENELFMSVPNFEKDDNVTTDYYKITISEEGW